MEKNTEVFIAV